ncbi:UNVERIFIED_CONTAM: hypothetical protein GTU68_007710 [Idotea baltica]|nr:hypothetical protein [Idotea baltica]
MPTSTKRKKRAKTKNKDVQIFIKGAKSNNLKNLDVIIPKNKLVVVTGLSGSGKSSLIMDTLYAEGQRRYVESLSSYARQFLNRMKKPEVDFIQGICPAIAIEQRVTSGNNRSTVGSMTEIYDYMRLLYGRVGRTYSPVTGLEVKQDTVTDVVTYVTNQQSGTRLFLLSPLSNKYQERLLGYTRIKHQSDMIRIEEWLSQNAKLAKKPLSKINMEDFHTVIDRFVAQNNDEELSKRIGDSANTALHEGDGICIIQAEHGTSHVFNNKFERDGITFISPDPRLFNYNNPFGACDTCEGYGKTLGISPTKVIPNPNLSVFEGCVVAWKSEKASAYQKQFLNQADLINFPVHTPYIDLNKKQQHDLWYGTKDVEGIYDYFSELESKTYKIQNRVLLSRYRGRTVCIACNGSRLKKEALYIKVADKTIDQLIALPIDQLYDHFMHIQLNKHDMTIAERILIDLRNRLSTMIKVGLTYLTLDRISNTLSGGETQRIHLTRTLGSNLTASLYILDEPSIGLHPRDTKNLVTVLESLRDLGNTVVVVEHEEDVIRAADYIIDLGPRAGIHGGELVFTGDYKELQKSKSDSLTVQYLNGKKEIALPKQRRKTNNFIRLINARQFNLKNISVDIPLNALTVVSGVSGSGKTTLIKRILFESLNTYLKEPNADLINVQLEGDVHLIDQIELINQSPIGKSSRSNPITYVKAYDAIRKLMSDQRRSMIAGFKPKHFSFNVEGGRCEECKGDGSTVVEMQFLADIRLTCEECNGRRFQPQILDVTYQGKNIYDILNLSVEEALDFFKDQSDIYQKILPLYDVGLGYVKLGQSSNTLSGGEAQRVKLSSYLGTGNSRNHIVFIFDEPTTGLHFDDINRLLYALNALVEKGHTVIIVEHNMEVVKSADWVVDLGPEGGEEGGQLLYQGPPEGLVKVKASYTGQYLKSKLK